MLSTNILIENNGPCIYTTRDFELFYIETEKPLTRPHMRYKCCLPALNLKMETATATPCLYRAELSTICALCFARGHCVRTAFNLRRLTESCYRPSNAHV